MKKNRVIEVVLDYKDPWDSSSYYYRKHWAAKRKLMEAVAMSFKNQLAAHPMPLSLVNVEIDCTRYSTRLLDLDNLAGGVKPFLDAMVMPTDKNPSGIGLIMDDRPSILVRLGYDQQKVKRASGDARSEFIVYGEIPSG